MQRRGVYLLLVVVLVASAGYVFAQQNVGGITGRITDPSGAVVPRATVVALHQETSQEREAAANQNGIYIFHRLQIGQYTVTVKAPGFKSVERRDIPVVSGETVSVDLGLEVGEVTETVTVTAELPMLDSTSAQVGTTRTVLPQLEMECSPLN